MSRFIMHSEIRGTQYAKKGYLKSQWDFWHGSSWVLEWYIARFMVENKHQNSCVLQEDSNHCISNHSETLKRQLSLSTIADFKWMRHFLSRSSVCQCLRVPFPIVPHVLLLFLSKLSFVITPLHTTLKYFKMAIIGVLILEEILPCYSHIWSFRISCVKDIIYI